MEGLFFFVQPCVCNKTEQNKKQQQQQWNTNYTFTGNNCNEGSQSVTISDIDFPMETRLVANSGPPVLAVLEWYNYQLAPLPIVLGCYHRLATATSGAQSWCCTLTITNPS
jgi:hypothetical protein